MTNASPKLSNQVKNHNDAKSQLYQQALIESMDDALISTDKNLVITSWNKAAERIYNIEEANALGKRTTELVHYEYFDTSLEDAFNTLKAENHWKGVVKITRKDGKNLILQVSVTPVKSDTGEILGYVAVNRDITEDFTSRHFLRKLTYLLSSLQESFYIVDPQLEIIFINCKGNVGRLKKYKIGDHALTYVPEEKKARVYDSYMRSFNGETIAYESFTADKGENPAWYQFTYIPLKDELGEIHNVCVAVTNITVMKEALFLEEKRKEAELRLFESRKVFEDFMENSPLNAWITDEQGFIHYMNPPYLKFFGFAKSDIGKNLYELFPKDLAKVYMNNNLTVIQNKCLIESIEKVKNLDGSVSSYQVYKFPLTYKNEIMIAGWAVDITKQVNLQESLVELNKYKDKIVSVVTHDLKNYFTINYTTIEYLLNDYDNIKREEILKYLQILEKNNSRSLLFLEELTVWVKNALNRVTYNPQIIDLNTEIKFTIEFLAKQLADKNISVKVFCEKEKTAFADLVMFRTVTRNLLSNAINFSPEGSEIIVSTESDDSFVFVNIRDFGIGIPVSLQKKILSGENYESTYGTKGEKGLGLGLSLVKEFVEKNNGQLWIESSPEMGTTFRFSIPKTMKVN